MINATVVEREEMSNRAAGLSALLLSHVFFFQLLVYAFFYFDYQRVKEYAPPNQRNSNNSLVAGYN